MQCNAQVKLLKFPLETKSHRSISAFRCNLSVNNFGDVLVCAVDGSRRDTADYDTCHTDKNENIIFLIYKEIQWERVQSHIQGRTSYNMRNAQMFNHI